MQVIPRKRIHTPLSKAVLARACDSRVVDDFEDAFARRTKQDEALAFSSARFGLELVLSYYGVGSGDEVLLPAYNTPIVANVVRRLGARPVFVDVNADSFNLNADALAKQVSKRTRAVIGLHAHGNPFNVSAVNAFCEEHGLILVEDCAHALETSYHLKPAGSFGHAAVFSLGIGKELNTLGGGVVVTSDEGLSKHLREEQKHARRASPIVTLRKVMKASVFEKALLPRVFALTSYPVLRILRMFNKDPLAFLFEDIGVKTPKNAEFSRLQASLGLFQLEHPAHLKARRKNAHALAKKLSRIVPVQNVARFSKHSYADLVFLSDEREKMLAHLLARGIDAQPSWLTYCGKEQHTISRMISKRTVLLPVRADFSKETLARVYNAVSVGVA